MSDTPAAPHLPLTNRLNSSPSLYLRQHGEQPVHWQPWDAEALATARAQDRLILLSIGYAACHWCHVMAREAFSQPQIASFMNDHFVSIKVDREERPDIDHIYQLAHQLLTRRAGGWPLTVFLTPQQQPFFAGTYFPLIARPGLPDFLTILQAVHTAYQRQRAQVLDQALLLQQTLQNIDNGPAEVAPHSALAQLPQQALAQLLPHFDEHYGGIGDAPKFPHVPELSLALRSCLRGAKEALPPLLRTLDAMAQGGLFDHLGGGFFRYSTDRRWQIPHFEKMLYDQAMLLGLYGQAWTLTRNPLYRHVATQTVQWLREDMALAEGGFAASLDADVNHEEGSYYLWTPQAIAQLLSAQDAAVFNKSHGLDDAPNFEGQWHLTTRSDQPWAELAPQAESRRLLLAARRSRPSPARDDKMLTAWNGLLCTGLLRSALAFDEPSWAATALSTLDFIQRHLWHEGRLWAVWQEKQRRFAAYVDDYAFVLEALLASFSWRCRPEDMVWAGQLAQVLLDHFQDPRGGFFFTSDDHEALISRPWQAADHSTPSGNGVAALALQRLGHLLGESRYLQAAQKTLERAAPLLQQAPIHHATMLHVVEEWLAAPHLLVLRGPAPQVGEWRRVLMQTPHPGLWLIVPAADSVMPFLPQTENPISPRAWLCRGSHCLPPVSDLTQLQAALSDA